MKNPDEAIEQYQLAKKDREYKMSTEQQRKMLEAAAKACGIELWHEDVFINALTRRVSNNGVVSWNPLTNPADTAEMCLLLEIDTCWWIYEAECVASEWRHSECHDGTIEDKRRAWMLAATMVAAKIGDLK